MTKNNRYPQINIRSKNELAKRLSSKKFSQKQALELINDVLKNFDNYWYDSNKSEVEKGKFFRSSVGSPLHILLKLINDKVLKQHDSLIPGFIFGGISKKNHIGAAFELIGNQRDRTLLKLDITSFFEQISQIRVFHFFNKKCGCSVSASRLISHLCCVPIGKKGARNSGKTIARGFSTSSRLAVWTNLDTFLRIKWKAGQLLKGHDPKVAVFVDDIGISASRVSISIMEKLKTEVEQILFKFDKNQSLPVNAKKTIFSMFNSGAEHLGLKLGRKGLSVGTATIKKLSLLSKKIKTVAGLEKRKLKVKKSAYSRYVKQIEAVGKPN